ncbi:hypothetical protein CCAND93_460025 [Capnocytophaga canis]|uniref:Uncharacterized protein n=1 Tax=Capnocytophaga canis TaxID=1848903 RepID=A0A0B7ISE9_9FLAO|nr:hypothetical protein CCAND93_460025 [Capnocytophaga canis]
MLKWNKAPHSDIILTKSSKVKFLFPRCLNDSTYAKDLDYTYRLGWYIGENPQ